MPDFRNSPLDYPPENHVNVVTYRGPLEANARTGYQHVTMLLVHWDKALRLRSGRSSSDPIEDVSSRPVEPLIVR